LNVDAFIEVQRCFAGTSGFTSRVDSGVSISAVARNKEQEISCCRERRGCSEQVGTFIEAAGLIGGAAHSLRFQVRPVVFTPRRRLFERLKCRADPVLARRVGVFPTFFSLGLCRSGVNLDGPYNIRLHLTAPRAFLRRNAAVRGEPLRATR
jgi:hypothetical protein